jgi:hypothetical protein
MPKFIAKQLQSHLTGAEAIGQAKDGAAAAFEYLYKAHNGCVHSLLRMAKIGAYFMARTIWRVSGRPVGSLPKGRPSYAARDSFHFNGGSSRLATCLR